LRGHFGTEEEEEERKGEGREMREVKGSGKGGPQENKKVPPCC